MVLLSSPSDERLHLLSLRQPLYGWCHAWYIMLRHEYTCLRRLFIPTTSVIAVYKKNALSTCVFSTMSDDSSTSKRIYRVNRLVTFSMGCLSMWHKDNTVCRTIVNYLITTSTTSVSSKTPGMSLKVRKLGAFILIPLFTFTLLFWVRIHEDLPRLMMSLGTCVILWTCVTIKYKYVAEGQNKKSLLFHSPLWWFFVYILTCF